MSGRRYTPGTKGEGDCNKILSPTHKAREKDRRPLFSGKCPPHLNAAGRRSRSPVSLYLQSQFESRRYGGAASNEKEACINDSHGRSEICAHKTAANRSSAHSG